MKRSVSAVAAAALLLTGPMIQAAEPARASAAMEGESALGNGLPLSVVIVLLTVLGGAIYLVVDDDDNPDSP